MAYTEVEQEIANKLDTTDVRRYENNFVDFYSSRTNILELLKTALLTQHNKKYEAQLEKMVPPTLLFFKRCIRDILETTDSQQEFALEVTEFIAQDQNERLDAMYLIAENHLYVKYKIADIHQRVFDIFRTAPDITVMMDAIGAIFEEILQCDIGTVFDRSEDHTA